MWQRWTEISSLDSKSGFSTVSEQWIEAYYTEQGIEKLTPTHLYNYVTQRLIVLLT